MNEQLNKVAREALTRELEHHIDELCDYITEYINNIKNNNNITLDNFEVMTYVGESLECLHDGAEQVSNLLLKVKMIDQLTPPLSSITITDE